MTQHFYDFMQTWLRETQDVQAVHVTNIVQVTNSTGYCDSCYSEWEEIHITYVDMQGDEQKFEYYGSMAEILRLV